MLTPRLQMIADCICTKSVADIGCDHAYISIYLAENNISDRIIATDLKEGPLAIARSNIEKKGLSSVIETRLGSGISPILENEAETFIISGMGGELIESILKADIQKAKKAKYLVLQPMNSQDTLRKWLSENGFAVIEEDIATEGFKVYNLIVVKQGEGTVYKNELDLHIPSYLYNHKNFVALKNKKIREFTKIKQGLLNASERDIALIKKYSDFLSELERL